MKKKIIIWALIIILSLSSVATAGILLINSARNTNSVVALENDMAQNSDDDRVGDEEKVDSTDEDSADEDSADEDSTGSGSISDGGSDDGGSDDGGSDDGGSDDDKKDEYCTVRFETNGGDAVNAIKVEKGETLADVPTTQKRGAIFDGWYNDNAFTECFYQSEPIYTDTTLYAGFDEVQKQEELLYEKFVLTDQQPDITFIVHSDSSLTTEQVLERITLEIADGSSYITLNAQGNNPYTISAEGGFTPGASYVLTLGEGLTFDGKQEYCCMCSFSIHKDEVMNLSINKSLLYVPADDVSNIIIDGQSAQKISSGLFGNDKTAKGTFTYNGIETLAVDEIICIYIGAHPNDRVLNKDYIDQDIAYVKISAINGTTIAFESIEEDDAQEVLFMPDTIPIEISAYADDEFEDEAFDFDFDPADYAAHEPLGIDVETTIDPGDFIVLYDESDADYVAYLEIVTVSKNGSVHHIEFDFITLEEMKQAMEYFVTETRSGEQLLSDVDVEALEEQIEQQALNSGFAEEAMNCLAVTAVQTDGFEDISGVEDFVIETEDGEPLSEEDMQLLWEYSFTVEHDGIEVTASISDETQNFGEGVRVALGISGEYTVDVGDGGGQITIKMSATFVQEVAISFDVNGSVDWGVYWAAFIPIPYIEECTMSVSIAILDFTGISFNVHITSSEADDDFDITEELKGLLDMTDPEELDAGVEDLFEKYGEMLETETDYIEIFNKSILDKSGWVDPLFIIAYNIQINFKIKADVNIMLGANLEYKSGTKYIFWFKIVSEKAGSNTIDLIDETFAFQFYVMGKLGLRVGLEFKFAIGLFSTDLASIGLSAEAGPYLELYGYFIYEYYKIRAANTPDWATTEQMMGALYLEFGIYFESYFNADALGGEYSYSYELYSDTWELLTAGVRAHVYDYAYDIADDETFVIRDVTSAKLPSSYRNMAVLDLKFGNLSQDVYSLDKYKYRLSNSNFSFDKSSGRINVDVPYGVQYMECDLTITWIVDKLAFRKNDLTSTIHLVWTSLTSSELKERFDVSVKVGNKESGYTTVWSDRVIKNSVFMLPTEDEIKELIRYNDYNVRINDEIVNLLYSACDGYLDISSLQQRVRVDTTYIFEVTDREYTLIVDAIQNADGGTQSEAFTAKYDEAFDLSGLEDTGTNIGGQNPKYTKYLRTNCSIDDGRQATDVIDSVFAVQLIEDKASYTAEYVDNSCEVTYHFEPDTDMDIQDVVVKVAKDTRPNFDYTAYLAAQRPSNKVKNWNIKIGKVTGDTTFTAYCTVTNDTMYTITFEENGGSEVEDYQRFFDQPIQAPTNPTRYGYTFDCWCEDAALQQEYVFDRMPEKSFTLYARWVADTVTVNLNAGAYGTLSTGDSPMTVTFGEVYGDIPTPQYNTTQYRFNGWYKTTNYVKQVITGENGTEVTNAGEHVLYAHIEEIPSIPENYIVFNNQVETYATVAVEYMPGLWYDEPIEHAYTSYTFNNSVNPSGGGEYPQDRYKVWYRRSGDSEFTDVVPTDAGDYYIRLTRDADDDYQAFAVESTTAVLIVNQAAREYVPNAPDYDCIGSDKTFVLNSSEPANIWNDSDACDGLVRYAATKTNVRPAADSEAWVPESQLGYDNLNTTYYLWTKIEGRNYEDAFSNTYTEVFVPSAQPGG